MWPSPFCFDKPPEAEKLSLDSILRGRNHGVTIRSICLPKVASRAGTMTSIISWNHGEMI